MRTPILALAAALALGLGATAANAHTFLIRLVNGETGLTRNIYDDGVLIQSVVVGNELSDPAWARLENGFYDGAKLFEAEHGLSDTWQLTGVAGDTGPKIPVNSDKGTALLGDALGFQETDGFQTVLKIDVSNGNHYIWQFSSPLTAGVPEPATWAMMLLGIGMIGLGLRGLARANRALAALQPGAL